MRRGRYHAVAKPRTSHAQEGAQPRSRAAPVLPCATYHRKISGPEPIWTSFTRLDLNLPLSKLWLKDQKITTTALAQTPPDQQPHLPPSNLAVILTLVCVDSDNSGITVKFDETKATGPAPFSAGKWFSDRQQFVLGEGFRSQSKRSTIGFDKDDSRNAALVKDGDCLSVNRLLSWKASKRCCLSSPALSLSTPASTGHCAVGLRGRH